MKTIKIAVLTLMLYGTGTAVLAQDQKKFKVMISKEINGESVLIDTTFNSKTEMQNYLKSVNTDINITDDMVMIKDEFKDLENLQEINVEVGDVDFRKIEMGQLEEELKKLNIDLEELKSNSKVLELDLENMEEPIETDGSGEVKKGTVRMFINDDETGDDSEKKHQTKTVIVTCDPEMKMKPGASKTFIWKDSTGAAHKEIRIIRTDKDAADKGETKTIKIESEAVPPPPPPVKKESEDQSLSKAEDYKLNATDFKIYPNPSQGKINVSFKINHPGVINLKILDAYGKLIIEDEITTPEGYFQKEYTIEGKARGTYLLQLKQGDKWRHEKIIVGA
ncbi:MAG: T9SS type A sorting domain-containing protein [Bacteroidetes bacterium]|nr:T9SS type A sorting domain-containing protein [Bacteroidota bacterium]